MSNNTYERKDDKVLLNNEPVAVIGVNGHIRMLAGKGDLRDEVTAFLASEPAAGADTPEPDPFAGAPNPVGGDTPAPGAAGNPEQPREPEPQPVVAKPVPVATPVPAPAPQPVPAPAPKQVVAPVQPVHTPPPAPDDDVRNSAEYQEFLAHREAQRAKDATVPLGDPKLGEKDPVVMEWYRRNNPDEYRRKYGDFLSRNRG